jgi:hypothetical protein
VKEPELHPVPKLIPVFSSIVQHLGRPSGLVIKGGYLLAGYDNRLIPDLVQSFPHLVSYVVQQVNHWGNYRNVTANTVARMSAPGRINPLWGRRRFPADRIQAQGQMF